MITSKLADKWRHLLEEDADTTHPGQWLGLYVGKEDDPAFVVQCTNEFVPPQWQLQRVTLPLPTQCFTVGTYSRCLNEWAKPSGTLEGCFHEVKIIHTTRGPKNVKEEDRLTITFFYGKIVTLRWDPDRWRWADGSRFLNYTTKMGRDSVINRIPGGRRAAEKWQGYLPSNYRFKWSQVWDPLRSGKEAAFIWSIWHRTVAVNEWRARIAPASISKQCPFYMPNTSESIKDKFWDYI